MIVKTPLGTINMNDIEIGGEIGKLIKNHIDAALMFFSSETTIKEEDLTDELMSELYMALADDEYWNSSRAFAVIMHVKDNLNSEVDVNNLSSIYNSIDEFDYEGEGTFLVLTDEEADTKVLEHIESLLDDIGIFEAFPDNMVESILAEDSLIDRSWFEPIMQDNNYDYVQEIENEAVNEQPQFNEPINRLHEELIENNLMDEPEWPEEPEDEDSDEWSEWQSEMMQLYEETLQECEQNKDDYIEILNNQYDSAIEWYREHFGDEALSDIVKRHNLLYNDKIAKWVFDHGYTNRGDELASYDGQEWEISFKFNGKDFDYYIYQTN